MTKIKHPTEEEILFDNVMHEYGFTIQESVCVEEMAELQQELSKYVRGRGSIGRISEEIADVQIMLDQMIRYFDCREYVEEKRRQKIERIRERLADRVL